MSGKEEIFCIGAGAKSPEEWFHIPSHEMNLEQARTAVKDLRRMLANYMTEELESGMYIKVYGRNTAAEKAEKLYQICDESELPEVLLLLREYMVNG